MNNTGKLGELISILQQNEEEQLIYASGIIITDRHHILFNIDGNKNEVNISFNHENKISTRFDEEGVMTFKDGSQALITELK